jgi:hypothetical protein
VIKWFLSDDEADATLRGDERNGFVGMSAVDGLIAAVVAGPPIFHSMTSPRF